MTTTAAGLISTSDSKYSRCRSTSANRRAFWIATPTLAAIVASSRTSGWAKRPSSRMLWTLITPIARVAGEDRDSEIGERGRADASPDPSSCSFRLSSSGSRDSRICDVSPSPYDHRQLRAAARRSRSSRRTRSSRPPRRGVMGGLKFTMANKRMSLLVAFAVMGLTLFSFKFLGSEFLPELNEGALWVEAKLPMSSSLTETVSFVTQFRKILNSFDEVDGVLSQTGRSNDGTDPSGFYYVQCQVNLKQKKFWKRKISTEQLVDEMDARLRPSIPASYTITRNPSSTTCMKPWQASMRISQ